MWKRKSDYSHYLFSCSDCKRTQTFEEKSKDNYFSNLKEFLNEEEMKALLIRDINTCGLGGDLDKFVEDISPVSLCFILMTK